MVVSDRTFRIFVSSTFSDLKEERNALQGVFSDLRKLCMEHGCRFQAIDLRWGVSEDAAYDQQTMKICMEEIKRCQMTTPKPNFIILLGDRHGWQPLPYEIPAPEFEEIITNLHNNKADRNKLLMWYKCDNNTIPPVYCLQPRTGKYRDGVNWKLEEKEVLSILQNAISDMSLMDKAFLKYGAAATELEIIQGALNIEDAGEHVFGFFRNINGLPEDESAKEYIDLDINNALDIKANNRLTRLKDTLRLKLGKNVMEYDSNWTGNGITYDHLSKLCEDVKSSLSKIIISQIDEIEKIDDIYNEVSVHSAFAKERSRLFVGRVDALNKISEYVDSDNNYPLWVYGLSGSGKTALMAKAIEHTLNKYPDASIVYRFIGATPESPDIRALLVSLCGQISRCYSLDETTIPDDYQELVKGLWARFSHATKEKPLILFLDALDQLSDLENGKNLTWLPYQLPDNVHVIVSVLSDDYCYSVMEKRPRANIIIRLDPLSPEEVSNLLDLWLTEAGRTLERGQRSEILSKFSVNGLPLYMKLAFEESKKWKSYSDTKDCILSPDISGIINDMLDRLSLDSDHGIVMVSKSLGYIAASRYGLTDDEIIDVLSADKEVTNDFRHRSPKSPIVDKLPFIIWSRLYFDLKPYLMEKSVYGAVLLTFYHRKLAEAVDSKYLSKENGKDIHLRLADYFSSYDLDERKIDELPWQLEKAESLERLKDTITNIDMFLKMGNEVKKYELMGYWLTISSKYDMVKEYTSSLETYSTNIPPVKIAYINNEIARFFYDNAKYDGAEPLFRRALAIREKVSGPEHLDTAATLNSLAAICTDIKRDFVEAEILYRRALTIREKVSGPEHPDTAATLSNLAGLLMLKGDNAGAETLYKRALTIREKVLGPEHPDTAKSLNNLASLFGMTSDCAGAEPLYRRALTIWEKVLGTEHPDTASALNNLAAFLVVKGDYIEAETLYKRALTIREKVLGPEHPDTAMTLSNLSYLFGKKGDYIGAEPLQRRALAIKEKALGSKNPSTALSLFNLAFLLVRKGEKRDIIEAETLYRRALAIREKELGPEHDDTINSLEYLADLLMRKGDYIGAEPLFRRALAIKEKVSGPEHLDTAATLSHLAGLLGRKGDYIGAEPLLKRILSIREKVSGPEHPDTANSLHDLGVLLVRKEDYIGAEPLFRRALAIREKVSGPEHPDTANSLNDLSFILERKGDYAEAELLLRRALTIYENYFGEKHPYSMSLKNNLLSFIIRRAYNDALNKDKN